jgi:hypothetical protein
MSALCALWLPILLATVAVYVASSIIHMATPWHKGDYKGVADQESFMAALRPFALTPGDYMTPRPASMADMRSAEFKALHRLGPVIVFTVLPSGVMRIGPQLIQWVLCSLVVSLFAGYVASSVLPIGTSYLRVFQIVGTTAFLGYAGALVQQSIWYGRSWSMTIRTMLDGLLYALLTAGVFGWLWPH